MLDKMSDEMKSDLKIGKSKSASFTDIDIDALEVDSEGSIPAVAQESLRIQQLRITHPAALRFSSEGHHSPRSERSRAGPGELRDSIMG